MHAKLSPIFKRRSIRRYEQREIAPSLVRDLLEAAMAAPSACCEDPWRGQATGYAGDPNVKTPGLDRFARQSLRFDHAVSGCRCAPPTVRRS